MKRFLKQLPAVAGTLALACALSLTLSACDKAGEAPKTRFSATDITGSDWGKGFELKDPQGRTRTLAEFKGKAVVVFFGFTQCPDVCPTTLATAAGAMKELGADAERVQVVFITLDPPRDTPQVLEKYATAFHPAFLALSGDPATIDRTAKEFKIFYQKQPGTTPETYTIDHTAASYGFDPEGRLRLYIKHGETSKNMASDLKQLLAGK